MSASSHAEVVAGTPRQCLDALLDFDSYPEWQGAVQEVAVRERGDTPVVEFTVDARVRTIRYVLRYHPEPPSRLRWEYVEGDVRSIAGGYELEDLGDGTTRATYRVELDPGRFVPGPVRKLLTEGVMRASVRDLKRRVEGS